MSQYNQSTQSHMNGNSGQYIRRDYHFNTNYPNTSYHNNSQSQQNSIMIERHYIPIDLYREMYGLPPQRTSYNVPPPVYPTVNRHNTWDALYSFDLYSPFYNLNNLNTDNTSNNVNSQNNNNTGYSSSSINNNSNTTNTTNVSRTTNTSNTPRATFIPTSSTNTSNNGNTNNSVNSNASASVNRNNTTTTTTGSANSYNALLSNIFNRYIERTMATNVSSNATSNNQTNNTSVPGAQENTTSGNDIPRPRGYVELQMFDNLSDTPIVISSNLSNASQGTQVITSILNALTTLNNSRNGGEDNENQHGLTAQEIFDNTTLHIFNDDLSDEIDETEDPKCSICQAEFNDGQRLRRIEECEHYFHKRCIDTWFTTHHSCPMCRTNVVVALN